MKNNFLTREYYGAKAFGAEWEKKHSRRNAEKI